MCKLIRRHLGMKFFISYFVVILIGIVVLISATKYTVPNAFNRHMAEMTAAMGPAAEELEIDLYTNFEDAVNESLLVSAAAAFISAVVVSIFVTQQVVAPIQRIRKASQHIAEGHYNERVQIPENLNKGEMDELVQLSASFNQMTLRLERAESIRKQLIGDIAHELRTPLSTIKGYLEGLIDGVLPAESATFHQVYQEAERLQLLVNDLQDLNRVESGAYRLKLHTGSIKDVIDLTESRLVRQFQEKGVLLANEVPEDLPDILLDEDRMGQVLMNLIGNSLQYTPGGGRVRISAWREDQDLRVSIADSGVGISAEDLPHIFARFYRADKSRSRVGGGSGIGLTIAKHLVESHGGRIWAESPGLGLGSTFYLELPLPDLIIP